MVSSTPSDSYHRCDCGDVYVVFSYLLVGRKVIGCQFDWMWVFPKKGVNPKWMVYNGKPHKMDNWGIPFFLETPMSLISLTAYIWSNQSSATNDLLKTGTPSLEAIKKLGF